MTSAKNRARQWVRDGVKSGRIVKPARCPKCGSTGHLSAHHPRGYDRYRDYEWLCRDCHEPADAQVNITRKHSY